MAQPILTSSASEQSLQAQHPAVVEREALDVN